MRDNLELAQGSKSSKHEHANVRTAHTCVDTTVHKCCRQHSRHNSSDYLCS